MRRGAGDRRRPVVVPLTSDADVVDTGATASMSGAAALDRSVSASCSVSVDADPNPPRTPADDVELPGEITSRLVPSALMSSCTWARAPWPMPTVSTTAVIPMRMPSIVSAERSRCERTASVAVWSTSRQFMQAPATSDRCVRVAGDLTVVIWMTRSACSATSCSWVISTIVLPRRGAPRGSPSTSCGRARVEIAGRFVGEEHRRFGDERTGDRDTLLLTAGELTGPMLDSIRRDRHG